MTIHDAEHELIGFEQARRQALLASHGERLDALLADDLLHIHTSGAVDTKQSYLAGVREKWEFLKVERSQISIKIYANAATMTGKLEQEIRFRETGTIAKMRGIATQVWVKEGERWSLKIFQATRIE